MISVTDDLGVTTHAIEADDMRKLAQVLRGMADERRRTLGLGDDGTARALDHVASGIDLTLATESNGQ